MSITQGRSCHYIGNSIVLVKNWSNNGTRGSNNPTKTNTLLVDLYVLPNAYYTKGWCKHFMSIAQ
jgi:hypothetical protein